MGVLFQNQLNSQSFVFLCVSSNCRGRKSTNYIELVDLCIYTLSWTGYTLSFGLGTLGRQTTVGICTAQCAWDFGEKA